LQRQAGSLPLDSGLETRATGGNLPLGLGQQAATYHWAGASGNRQQPTTGQGPRATGGNLPLGRGSGNRQQPTTGQGGLGQQAATFHWAGASGNRRQPTTGQGPRATGGNLPLGRGSGNRQQPTTGQGPRGLNGTLAVETGHSTAPTQLSRVIGFMGTQRVAMAQALRGTTGSYTPGMPSGHGWSVHTQGSSEHGWSVHTAGTVQDTGCGCTQPG
ncbi:unnamed protein product, partial [Staurois parvus]